MNQVTISFVGPPNISPSSIVADLTIVPAQPKKWYFAAVNNIILPVSPPGVINLALHCGGFSSPAEISLPLAQYVNSRKAVVIPFLAKQTISSVASIGLGAARRMVLPAVEHSCLLMTS